MVTIHRFSPAEDFAGVLREEGAAVIEAINDTVEGCEILVELLLYADTPRALILATSAKQPEETAAK